MSSLSFQGNTNSYLRIPNSSQLNFGTGDFTIEWYQYQTDSNSFPRIFQIGTYSFASIGFSIEGGSVYYWANGPGNLVTTLASSSYKNVWVHFAISRSSGVTKVFMNGTSLFSMSDTNNFNSAEDLIISNETTRSSGPAFGGYMTYFTWVKGSALYTNNFTVSNTYPTLTGAYVLFLQASGFTGTLGNTVVNVNVSTTQNVPTGFSSNVLCFREDTEILCLVKGRDQYVPIQLLRKGTLVKTYLHGYVPIETIASSKLYNPPDDLRSKTRLYKLKPARYSELTKPLYLTGCHSVLVNGLSKEERDTTVRMLGKLFVTDDKYRLMACIDERANPYSSPGIYTIWHFALKHDDYYMNYGVYANGLLVESSSRRMMSEYFGR